MERKIGETFEYEGNKLRVEKSKSGSCVGCFFNGQCPLIVRKTAGECQAESRGDNKGVVFVEVLEQQTKEPKERKIGEVFECQGKKLKVVQTTRNLCHDCYFWGNVNCQKISRDCGECSEVKRTDHKPVIFKEVEDEPEEHQEERPQKMNLCEILKDCPGGWMFWSPMLGNVWFCDIDQYTKRIKVKTSGVASWYINADGTITIDKVTSPEIMLYPSRKQRDWSKFTAPWYKKERFDPKTLKVFDKVLVFDSDRPWTPLMFSYLEYTLNYPRMQCFDFVARKVIPYNDETKHLVGTTDEAPDFYRYWEE